MTLMELSKEYRAQSLALRGRVAELRAARGLLGPGAERLALDGRIRMLETMLREARELAVLTEHYYDRGYRRNGRYNYDYLGVKR